MNHSIPTAIRHALRRRGISVRDDEGGASDDLLITTWSAADRDLLYQQMQRYAFRLVLRDVIRLGQQGDFELRQLARHAGIAAVRRHLALLQQLGVVQQDPADPARHRLMVPAATLGPTLEWLVGEILRRELGFCVGWSLPLRGGQTGGDLDVVALAEGCFLVVEVKSGPPKHVNLSHVAAFLDRIDALAPHGAIFLEDTELRMTDKVVQLFAQELARRDIPARPERMHRELYRVGSGIFIANAHPDLTGNLTRCVIDLFHGRGLQLGVDLGRRAR